MANHPGGRRKGKIEMKPPLPPPARFVGVYIEQSRVRVAVEEIDEDDLLMKDKLETRFFDEDSFEVNAKDENSGRQLLQCIAKVIAERVTNIKGIGIGSYGPFIKLGAPSLISLNEKGYGCLHDKSDLPFRNADLPSIFREPFERADRPVPVVAAQTDANVAAIGEAWHRGLDENDILVSLLLTTDIGGGMVAGRQLRRTLHPGFLGSLHPEVGLMPVIPHAYDPIKGKPKKPDYESSLGNLTSINQMIERAKKLDLKDTSFDAILQRDDDGLWPVLAYYLAQFCLTCTAVLTPRHIVINGSTFNGRPGFVDEVRKQFKNFKEVRLNQPFEYMPDYAYADEEDFICGPSEGRLFPEIAGCVYLAMMAYRATQYTPKPITFEVKSAELKR